MSNSREKTSALFIRGLFFWSKSAVTVCKCHDFRVSLTWRCHNYKVFSINELLQTLPTFSILRCGPAQVPVNIGAQGNGAPRNQQPRRRGWQIQEESPGSPSPGFVRRLGPVALPRAGGFDTEPLVEFSTEVNIQGDSPQTITRQLRPGIYLIEIRERDIDLRVKVGIGILETTIADDVPRHGLHVKAARLAARLPCSSHSTTPMTPRKRDTPDCASCDCRQPLGRTGNRARAGSRILQRGRRTDRIDTRRSADPRRRGTPQCDGHFGGR